MKDMDFQSSIEQSGLNTALAVVSDLSPAGRPPITQEVADVVLKVLTIEKSASPTLLAFTMLCESSFNLASLPNDNGHKQNPGYWDCGPWQLDQWWARKLIHDQKMVVDEALVFGSAFFNADMTPAPFSGDPVWNGVVAARMLTSLHPPNVIEKSGATINMRVSNAAETERFHAVYYTSETHRDKRGKLWDVLHGNFEQFFLNYQP